MKKYQILMTFMLSLTMIWSACSDFVNEVDPIIDQVEDDLLTDESQIPFLTTGVEIRFATTHDRITVFADGLSDALIFDQNVPDATFPQFKEMDEGDIQLDNNSVDGMFFDLGELRFFSDDLLRRINEIGTFQDAEVQRQGLYTAYLYGGIARYFFATYMGLNPTEGGGVIDDGPFIPSSEMYNLALEKLQLALDNAGSDYERRVVNSIIARTHLYAGDPGAALPFAQQGLVAGDAPFQSLHSNESSNYAWLQAGLGRSQWVANGRFNDYVLADPNEADRIPLTEILGNDGTTTFFLQVKYDDIAKPYDFITWQENELMLAELELNSNNASALARVNAVRASHGIGALTALDQNTLIEERDKELFMNGQRLVDQRRFGLWHLGPNTWQYLPITQSERNNNPNL